MLSLSRYLAATVAFPMTGTDCNEQLRGKTEEASIFMSGYRSFKVSWHMTLALSSSMWTGFPLTYTLTTEGGSTVHGIEGLMPSTWRKSLLPSDWFVTTADPSLWHLRPVVSHPDALRPWIGTPELNDLPFCIGDRWRPRIASHPMNASRYANKKLAIADLPPT